MAAAAWQQGLAAALTGADPADFADLELPAAGAAEAAGLLAALAERGWTAAALAAHAEAVWAAGEPWPHPVGAGAMAAVGAARWQSALVELKRRLGLDSAVRPPSRRSSLTPDERRLLADRPPHYGS